MTKPLPTSRALSRPVIPSHRPSIWRTITTSRISITILSLGIAILSGVLYLVGRQYLTVMHHLGSSLTLWFTAGMQALPMILLTLVVAVMITLMLPSGVFALRRAEKRYIFATVLGLTALVMACDLGILVDVLQS